MNQPYFIIVFAHSLHGRLRRVHVPHQVLYLVLALALIGSCSLLGFISSYVRMTWKVANYNSLRHDIETLRDRYKQLQRESRQTNEQLANFQLLANEISLAYGIKRRLEGPDDISKEGRLVPTVSETLEQYNFLKSANLSRYSRRTPPSWHPSVPPSIWPVNGRLMSHFGRREDPFTGEGAFHTGIDLSVPTGTPVLATGDGVVMHAEYAGQYGRLVVVEHSNGMQTYYAHLSRFSVVTGQQIRRGEAVGLSGATGRATAPHLHYEVRVHGTPMNPYPYLTKTYAAVQTSKKDFPF